MVLPNTALEPTPTAPWVYGWFELYNGYRACGAARPSAWLSFGSLGHIHTMTSITPKRIEILQESAGDVVARHIELGKVAGDFSRISTGEIYFHYVGDGRRWYVNKSMSAFCEAAAVFNRYCELYADDEDTDDPAVWAAMSAQLRSELESIEPLGDSARSLWSATIEDSEGGLLSLC